MADLDSYRVRIDEIDREITKLFEERMNVVLNVAKYKMENNLPIFNRGREDEVIQKNIGYLENKDYSGELEEFYNDLMEVSRHLQKRKMQEEEKAKNAEIINKSKELDKENNVDKKIGFFGVSGSF